MEPDLSLVSTDSLIEEIINRFEHIAIVGMKPGMKDGNVTFRRWKGNSATTTGLCTEMTHVITKTYLEESMEPDDE